MASGLDRLPHPQSTRGGYYRFIVDDYGNQLEVEEQEAAQAWRDFFAEAQAYPWQTPT